MLKIQDTMKEYLLLFSPVSPHVHWLLDSSYLWVAIFNFSVIDTIKQSKFHFLYCVLGEGTEKLIQKTRLTSVVCLKMTKAISELGSEQRSKLWGAVLELHRALGKKGQTCLECMQMSVYLILLAGRDDQVTMWGESKYAPNSGMQCSESWGFPLYTTPQAELWVSIGGSSTLGV